MKSKYQKDWDRGESFVFVDVSPFGRGLHKELVPVKYVVARNKVTGDEIDYMVWKKMSNEEQDLYELVNKIFMSLSLTTELEDVG